MIDWQFFFLAWELKGKYPAILDQPVARELFDEANTAARRDHRRRVVRGRRAPTGSGPRTPRATTSSWTAADASVPDAAAADGQAGGAPEPLPRRLRRPVRRPPRRLRRRDPRRRGRSPPGTRSSNDDYRAIMVKALADRLAEAFAEYIHLEARRAWFEPGRRPGPGGSARGALPRHPPRARLPGQPGPQPRSRTLFDLLDGGQARHGPDRVVRDDARPPASAA